jgi:hypothetical protein
MVEAARTSETLVKFYQTTRLYNPEDSHFRKEFPAFVETEGSLPCSQNPTVRATYPTLPILFHLITLMGEDYKL